MKKLINNQIFSNIFNICIIIGLFIYLIPKFKYSVITNDDMIDLIILDPEFFHGRFISELIAKFLVYILPDMLQINIQNFAVIASGIVKSTVFIVLSCLCGYGYNFFNKNNVTLGCLILFSFVLLFSFLFNHHFLWVFHTFQFYFGYVLPIVYYLICWFIVGNFYINNRQQNLSIIIILSVLSLFVAMGNQEVMIAFISLLLFLSIDSIVKVSGIIKQLIPDYIFIPLISSLLTCIFIIQTGGFQKIINSYGLSIEPEINSNRLGEFFYVYLNKLFLDNWFLWIPLILCCIVVLIKYCKDKKEIDIKVFKFVTYSYCGFLIFFLTLYFLGPSFTYENYPDYHLFPRYWILHPGLLFGFKVFLWTETVFLCGYIYSTNINNKIKAFIFCLIITLTCCHIYNHFDRISISEKSQRETVYLLDKFAVFYFSKGEIAVLPKDNADFVLPTYNNCMPKDLETDNYLGKVYNDSKQYWYLRYIKIAYGINSEPGMSFLPKEEAIKAFEQAGGKFEPEELEKLDFSIITKQKL